MAKSHVKSMFGRIVERGKWNIAKGVHKEQVTQ